MIGAAMPIVRYPGRNPIAAVEPPMISSVVRNANLRPTRSPSRPKKSAPNGRTAKPTANVASVLRKLAVALPGGIKLCREDRRETSEDEEVVPFDHRAGGGRGDDAPDSARRLLEFRTVLHGAYLGDARRPGTTFDHHQPHQSTSTPTLASTTEMGFAADDALLDVVSSASIACGAHAGIARR